MVELVKNFSNNSNVSKVRKRNGRAQQKRAMEAHKVGVRGSKTCSAVDVFDRVFISFAKTANLQGVNRVRSLARPSAFIFFSLLRLEKKANTSNTKL